MNNKPDNISELLRRALASQVELGQSEVIISRKAKKRFESDGHSESGGIQVSELFPDLGTESLGHPEYDS